MEKQQPPSSRRARLSVSSQERCIFQREKDKSLEMQKVVYNSSAHRDMSNRPKTKRREKRTINFFADGRENK